MASIKPILRPQHLRGVFTSATSSSTASPLSFPQLFFLQSSIRGNTHATSPSSSSPFASSSASYSTRSAARRQPPAPQIPPPTPMIPDVSTFLSVIGRDLKQHASKIQDWETLFTLTSEQLRELGVEPPRSRKYLLRWRQRFREGHYGVGGDLRHVKDGVAHLRILDESDLDPAAAAADPARVPRKYVVNVPAGRPVRDCDPADLSRVLGYHVEGANTIVGPYAIPLKNGQGARITITDGMWEDRQGHKIDGGERRRTEVRYKRRIAERREARERGEL